VSIHVFGRLAHSRAKSIAGLRVLITGGSSGIGLVTARQLVEAGARVILVARGTTGLSDAASTLGGATIIAGDVGDPSAIDHAIEQAASHLGGLDAVIANAGAATYGPFMESAAEDYQQTIRTTLLGVVNTAHAALPHLERSHGTLVVVGSVAGRLPTPWLSAYAAAKHGVRGFVRSLMCELHALRKPIRVALITPGPVDTPFWRRARTTDGRLPPELRGAYRAEEVAAEVLRALRGPPRLERTLGGLYVPAIILDALVPNRVIRPIGVGARLAWRSREHRQRNADDAFAQPTVVARQRGGLSRRVSILRKLRDFLRRDMA
jgi:NAD(P)-dependent dehydrogenase (short-subunit alcohol dehydrogenase family)